jgi:hypothetical protein
VGQNNKKDIWQEKLDIELEKLQKCQKSLNITDCQECEKLIGCEIRNNYVQSVYNSMNEGKSGGFEF